MDYWQNQRVVVTGGNGFLGQYIVRKLKERMTGYIGIADLDTYDLRKTSDIIRMYEEQKPDIIIHLAAVVGGIGQIPERISLCG